MKVPVWIPAPAVRALRFARRHLRLVAAIILVPTLAVAGANVWIIRASARYRYDRIEDVPSRQTAIVLGALVHPSGEPSAILRDRLAVVLDLYRGERVAKIIVSGDHGRRAYDEVNTMRRWLLERGVAEQDVFMDHAGFDTFDTMARARRVFQVDSAIVVTQDFHLSRAVWLARSAGIDAVGLRADRRRYGRERWNVARECLARVKAFAEVASGAEPRYLGPVIPITGDGRATCDVRPGGA